MKSHCFNYRTFLVICLLIASVKSNAQNSEFGLFMGGTYYMGELNPRNHFVGVTNPVIGVFHDAHINTRYYWRTMISYGTLTGDDGLNSSGLSQFRSLKFNSKLYELSGQIHFNFLPYGFSVNETPFTPYLFIGLSVFHVNPQVSSINADTVGTALPKESYSRSLTSVSIPMGFGFKAMLGSFTFGIEWSFRKTFTDKIDGIDNQYMLGNTNVDPVQYPQPKGFQKGSFNTDDWYSYAGITISFRPKPNKNACPK